MRSRQLAASALAALGISLSFAGTSEASPEPTPVLGRVAVAPLPIAVDEAASCYEQLDHLSGIGVVSQKFEPEWVIYNTRGADDFTLATSCRVRSVDVVGTHFSGTGPADSESVVTYADGGGRPGAVIARDTVVGSGSMGSYHLSLSRPVRLPPGTYWLSVPANMPFVDGTWGWEVASVATGSRAVWKNQGGGFGVGCTTYQDLQGCLGDGAPGPDFMFAVNRAR